MDPVVPRGPSSPVGMLLRREDAVQPLGPGLAEGAPSGRDDPVSSRGSWCGLEGLPALAGPGLTGVHLHVLSLARIGAHEPKQAAWTLPPSLKLAPLRPESCRADCGPLDAAHSPAELEGCSPCGLWPPSRLLLGPLQGPPGRSWASGEGRLPSDPCNGRSGAPDSGCGARPQGSAPRSQTGLAGIRLPAAAGPPPHAGPPVERDAHRPPFDCSSRPEATASTLSAFTLADPPPLAASLRRPRMAPRPPTRTASLRDHFT